MRDSSFDFIMKSVKKYPVLSRKEQNILFEDYKNGNSKAKDKLINSNLRFVLSRTHKYKNYCGRSGITMQDIFQEGCLGLSRAVDKFKPELGYNLITYAVWWIDAYIKAYVVGNFHLVRMGTTSSERVLFFKSGEVKKITNARDSIEADKYRKELSEKLNVSEDKIKHFETKWNSLMERSLDNSMGSGKFGDDGQQNSFHNIIGGATSNPEKDMIKSIDAKKLNVLMDDVLNNSSLNDREKDVLKRRFLIEDPETLQEVATSHGISRERIRQIQQSAIKKMKVELDQRLLCEN